MSPYLRAVGDLPEALALAPLFDRCAEEAMREFRDEPLPPAVARRFLDQHFTDEETLVLLAEEEGRHRPSGLCVTGPFVDPLTQEILPMVVLLWVDPEFRHRGLARRLVDGAQDMLRERGLPVLAARAGHNDDALISMGERWGFLRTWELMVRE